MAPRLNLSKEAATNILRAYDDEFSELVSLEEWKSLNHSIKTYTASYSRTSESSPDANEKVLITLASFSRSLDTLESLHKMIRTHTAIPLPTLLKRDDTTSLIPNPYSLFSHPTGIPLGELYTAPTSSNPDRTLVLKIELKLGALTKALHDRVQNDWFGLPGEDDENKKEWGECYSWQECFTLLLEGVLEEVGRLLPDGPSSSSSMSGDGGIPTQNIHRLLSRAIGSFLFDDVEVPSLIFHLSPSVEDWLSRVFVSSSSGSESATDEEPEITALVDLGASSLWGDPLLEGCFASSFTPPSPFASSTNDESENKNIHPEWPSKAFLEGYASTPIILPRHRTKRLWYDLYAALRELVVFLSDSAGRYGDKDEGEDKIEGEGDEEGGDEGKRKRGVKERIESINKIVRKLEYAPCY